MKLKHKKERKLNQKAKQQKYQSPNNKLQKGITLIALVITIIVLLILAGVSIATLTGDNGILTKAQTAKEETQKASEEEQRQLAALNASMNTETYSYKDKNNKEVPIPAGFAPTGIEGENSIEEGFVITDSDGNEFVWISCDEENGGVKYKRYNTVDRDGKETTDDDGHEDSVNANKGFYIARYEAGLPKEYWKENEDGTYEYKWDGTYVVGQALGERVNNPNNYTPVSKKNNPSWNGITPKHAIEVSENMYKGSTSVTSQLIDSYAWDTTVEWLKVGKNGIEVSDSTSYGNYVNSTINVEGLYACHRYHWNTGEGDSESSGWKIYADKYINSTLKTSKNENSGDVDVYEIATGSSEDTKTKNIYDLAGNMWEFTTEKRTDGALISRGCSFTNNGKTWPISYKSMGNTLDAPLVADAVSLGFRVVLYLEY